jgi:IS30 family transposase
MSWLSHSMRGCSAPILAARGSADPMRSINGLLRQFFPKGKDLSVYTAEDLARAEKLLNNRPRKILNSHTPDLVFTDGVA